MTTRLRPVALTDTDRLFSWRNHPDIRRWMFNQEVLLYENHKQWLQSLSQRKDFYGLIFEWQQEPIGFASFTLLGSEHVAEWGFYLSPFIDRSTEKMRGVGSALGAAMVNYGFTELQLHKIYGQVIADNIRSLQFHEKMNFVKEGCLKDHYYNGASFLNVYCFGLLRDCWQPSAVIN